MTEQEYKFIRNLSWDLLIDANISQLPVDINSIAGIYDLQSLINSNKSLYNNTLFISEGILKIFGLNNPKLIKCLTVRLISPMIVLKELNINSAQEVSDISGLPIDIAIQRFNRLQMLLSRNAFETSRLETIVLSQFREWINKFNKIKC